jgi:cytochrome d ubiquinol oxidase subunit II
MNLPLISALLTLFALTMYVLLDGFDLGVGALLLFSRGDEKRDRMVNAIAPTWDGNETWLVMTGVVLLGAFPVAYGVLLPAFYLPLFVMLMALGCRGVSIEFRFQPGAWRWLWDKAFGLGSIIAIACQGLMLGTLIDGVDVKEGWFTGSVLDVLRPFPVLMAVTLVAGYTVLGAAWLYYKTETSLQSFFASALRISVTIFAVLAAAAVGGAAWVQPGVGQAWLEHGHFLSALCVVFYVGLFLSLRALGAPRDIAPFLYCVLAFATGILGFAITIWPNIIPFRLSLWDAASPTQSHLFLLVGAVFVLPLVLGYNAYAYRIFSGKVPAHGYE